MKPYLKRTALPLSVCALLLASGCLTDSGKVGDDSTMVIYEKFCVEFQENRTTGDYEQEIVCDNFAKAIRQWLDDNGVEVTDIMNIFMSGGTLELVGDYGGAHPWNIYGRVIISRRDVFDPARNLLTNQMITIPDDLEGGFVPRFNNRGVRIVNRALWDFVEGMDPVLIVKLAGDTTVPSPSESDPFVLNWAACINIAVVLQVN